MRAFLSLTRAALPLALAVAAVMLLPVGVSVQEPLFTSRVDLVHVGVTVVGRDGRLVTDLEAGDFELFEDGRPQEIRYFWPGLADEAETVPLHLGILFDASGSMERDDRFVKTAALRFLNAIDYARDITLVDFDTEVRVARYGQRDFPRLVERVRSRRASGMTALYDALGVYLDGAFAQDGRKVLLVYTDGEDTRSRMRLSETMDLVRASDVTIYAIGFQKNLRSSVRQLQRMRLSRIAEISGGRSYFPDTVDRLDEIYEEIAAELRGRYALGFVSTNARADGTWRELEVRLTGPRAPRRATVRAREGYFAPWSEAEAR